MKDFNTMKKPKSGLHYLEKAKIGLHNLGRKSVYKLHRHSIKLLNIPGGGTSFSDLREIGLNMNAIKPEKVKCQADPNSNYLFWGWGWGGVHCLLI